VGAIYVVQFPPVKDGQSASRLDGNALGGLFPCDPQAAIRRADLRAETSMNPILWLITTLITLYIWIIIAAALMSWLIAFNVVNRHNQIVVTIADFLYRITEPALRPIRERLPNLGGIDISPVILIIGLLFIQYTLMWAFGPTR
jgi:YggT family protein